MELPDIRSKIDGIDSSIALLLSERIKLVREIAVEKKRRGLAIIDHSRERSVLHNIETIAQNQGLNQAEANSIRVIYKRIMKEAANLESDG